MSRMLMRAAGAAGGSFADAWVDDGFRGSKLRDAGPAAMLDAKNAERQRRCTSRNDAVLADDAILLAAADEFASEKQQGAPTAVDENELVDGSAGVVLRNVNGTAIASANQAFGALLANEDFAGGEAFFEGEERASVLAG